MGGKYRERKNKCSKNKERKNERKNLKRDKLNATGSRTLLSSSSFLMWSAMYRILSIAFWTSGEYWYDAKSGCSTGNDRIKWPSPFQSALLGLKEGGEEEKKTGKSATWPVSPLPGQSATSTPPPAPTVSVIESEDLGTSSSIKFPSPWYPGEWMKEGVREKGKQEKRKWLERAKNEKRITSKRTTFRGWNESTHEPFRFLSIPSTSTWPPAPILPSFFGELHEVSLWDSIQNK